MSLNGWSVLTPLALSLAALPAPAQNQLWIRQPGSPLHDEIWAAAPDGSGGVYVGGYTGNLGGGEDAWLARYDGGGNQAWIRKPGTSTGDWINAAAPDGSGGVYVGGRTWGSLGWGNFGAMDTWLARYDGAGNQLWIRQLGTSVSDGAGGVAPDGSGGMYVGGFTLGDLGGQSAGGEDAWLARYDSAGNQIWIRQFGSAGDDRLEAAALDGSGGVYVSGNTGGSLGGPNAGTFDAWLARYDSAGNQVWIRQLGTSANDSAKAVVPDGSGGVHVSGYTGGNLGGPNAGGTDVWLARYDAGGTQTWIRQFGTDTYEEAYAAAPDGSGGLYVSGHGYGDLGGPTAGAQDAWLARYDTAGTQLWIRQLGTSTYDYSYAAALDGSGGVYVGGSTGGGLGGAPAGGSDPWLARYDGGCPTLVTYCTAKVNSLGCTPSIAMSGAPSASATSGCALTTTSVIANKAGLYFHSTNGAASMPFHGGYLCAMSPIKRHPVLNSGGTAGTCGGVLTEDFNAYIAGGSDPALVSGTQVWIQSWSRDPGDIFGFGDSLSDAVTATICP